MASNIGAVKGMFASNKPVRAKPSIINPEIRSLFAILQAILQLRRIIL
ncbi:hypothetical protein GV51_0803 [Gardnerella vaginalis 5-1]|nr:hypothetical protein GV51_0803 [Gardnerella vaginalis 5-1]